MTVYGPVSDLKNSLKYEHKMQWPKMLALSELSQLNCNKLPPTVSDLRQFVSRYFNITGDIDEFIFYHEINLRLLFDDNTLSYNIYPMHLEELQKLQNSRENDEDSEEQDSEELKILKILKFGVYVNEIAVAAEREEEKDYIYF